MTAPLSVLTLDGDPAYLETLADHLERVEPRLSVRTETDAGAAVAAVERGAVDCLVTGVSPPGSEPLGVVEHVASAAPDVPVVVVDRRSGEGTAQEALEAGAAEFAPRSTDADALATLANRVTTVTAATDGADVEAEGLAAAAPVGVWVLDGDAVRYANRSCADLFARERSDLVGRSVDDLVAPGDRGTVDEHVDALLSGDATERTDVVTGVDRWQGRLELSVRGRRIETDGGPAVLGVVRDVTETRRDRRRLRALFEGLGEPVAEVALEDGRAALREVNPAFAETFGVDRADAADEYLRDLVVPEGAVEAAIDAYLRLERGERVDETVTRSTVDGEREVRLQGLPLEVGGDPHALVVYSPVDGGGDRERDLEALHSVARDLMAATDRETVAEVGVEAAGRVLDAPVACLFGVDDAGDALVPLAATDAAESLFDGVPAIPAGEGAAWFVHEMGDPVVTDDVRRMDTVYDAETEVRGEMLLPVGDHGVFVVSSTEVGAFDERDETMGRTLASTLEAALDRAEKERMLREREQELVRENERLEEFAGIVSHDLRSPLTVVSGNASLLREEGDPEYLDRIESAADRMETLIDDLLSLARQGSMVEEPEYVDLEETVTRAWSTADTRDATLSVAADVTVPADPSRLRQLLENLFNNAVEHGSTSPQHAGDAAEHGSTGPRSQAREDAVEHGDDAVSVRVGVVEGDADERPGGQYARHVEGFYVADDGPGLPEDREDLFEPGVSTDQDGTGFGLAIVERIAEAHGWTLEATESEAGGARFEFRDVDGV